MYKQGEEALNWYALLYGSLDVQISHTGKRKDVVNVCTLCSGTAFGSCVLNNGYHSVSVLSNEPCTLLRVPKAAFQDIWQRSSDYMNEIVTSPFSITNVDTQIQVNSQPVEVESGPYENPALVTTTHSAMAPVAVNQPETTVIPVAGEERLEDLQLPDNVSGQR